MTFFSRIRKVAIAATLSAGALAATAPAQAGSLERGLLAGLIGGLALGALAATAQAQHQGGPVFASVPVDPNADVYVYERPHVRPLRPVRPQPRRTAERRRPAGAKAPAGVATCGEVLKARASDLGAVDVKVSSAGPEARRADGGVVLPLSARIEYARKGQRQVRRARIACHLNPDRQVVAFQ